MALTQGRYLPPKARQPAVLILVILICNFCVTTAPARVYRLLAKPDQVIYCDIGQNVSLVWLYAETNETRQISYEPRKNREFLFGEWKRPGFVSNKILLVRGSAVQKREAYKSKVDYHGTLSNQCSNCTAEITLFNLTEADLKMYGISVFIYSYVNPLQSWLKLARRERARIKYWLKYVRAMEGNATSISCQADGKPRPYVEIQRRNKIVAKGMGETEFSIDNVKPEHAGDYYCVVYTKEKTEPVIKEEMKLDVQATAKMDVRIQVTTKVRAHSVGPTSAALHSTVLACLVVSLGTTFV